MTDQIAEASSHEASAVANFDTCRVYQLVICLAFRHHVWCYRNAAIEHIQSVSHSVFCCCSHCFHKLSTTTLELLGYAKDVIGKKAYTSREVPVHSESIPFSKTPLVSSRHNVSATVILMFPLRDSQCVSSCLTNAGSISPRIPLRPEIPSITLELSISTICIRQSVS